MTKNNLNKPKHEVTVVTAPTTVVTKTVFARIKIKLFDQPLTVDFYRDNSSGAINTGASYANFELQKNLSLLDFVKECTTNKKLTDFINDLQKDGDDIKLQQISYASSTNKLADGSLIHGSGFQVGLDIKYDHTDYPFQIQVSQAKKMPSPAGQKSLRKKQTTRKSLKSNTTSVSILSDLKFSFSEIPGLNIKLEKPITLKINRLSYTTKTKPKTTIEIGDDAPKETTKGIYYTTKKTQIDASHVNHLGTTPAKEGITAVTANLLEPGFSYAIKMDGPSILNLAASIGEKALNYAGSTSEPTDLDADDTSKFQYTDGVLWIKVDKKIGPLFIGRIGFTYQASKSTQPSKLTALFDASASFGPFSMAVIGLGISVPLNFSKMFKTLPTVSIQGFSMDFKSSTVEIAGMLLKEKDDYVGQLLVKLPSLTIIGTGIFGSIKGNKSVFIYGFLDKTLGGPPFFLVEGLALGFGYNRTCNVPLAKISEFPLTKQALNPDVYGRNATVDSVKKVANDLIQYIPAQEGTFILMFGIKFSTFKVIESFALLIVELGYTTRITLLGLSRMVLGVPDEPVVQIELAIKAEFNPEEGLVEVLGLLTPNSYVFSKDAMLTGGFAFMAWFSGEHKGDFVVSIGGYSSSYKKPAHYPDVPRVGLNWKVSELLTVKAQAYFALTPAECMLGGDLEIHFHYGPVSADFVAKADFLIGWKPFHYDAKISIDIKLAFHIHIKYVVNTTIHFDAGAELHIWGPDFSGHAQLHFYVSFFGLKYGFSAKINFGNTNAKKPPNLSWNEFQTAFLPKPPTTGLEEEMAIENTPKQLLDINVSKGLIKIEKDGTWLLNRKTIAINILSPIPITKYDSVTSSDSIEAWDVLSDDNRQLIVTPMGSKHLKSTLIITIASINGGAIDLKVEKSISKNLPSSLWGGKQVKGLLKDVPVGLQLAYGKPLEAGVTNAIPVKNFSFSTTPIHKISPVKETADATFAGLEAFIKTSYNMETSTFKPFNKAEEDSNDFVVKPIEQHSIPLV